MGSTFELCNFQIRVFALGHHIELVDQTKENTFA
jgi:hypothetical protein